MPTLSPPGVDQVHRLPLLDILVRSLVRSVTSSVNADAGGRAGNLDGEGVDAAYTFVVYVAYDEGDHMYDKRGRALEHLAFSFLTSCLTLFDTAFVDVLCASCGMSHSV